MFYDTEDLRDEEILLQLERTCEAQPEKKWVPAYYFAICMQDGTKIGYCDLRIGHNDKIPPALLLNSRRFIFRRVLRKQNNGRRQCGQT